MFEVEELDGQTTEIKVPYKGQVVTLKFAEDALSSKEMRELNLPAKAGEPEYGFNTKFVVRSVKTWDVVKKGKPVPLELPAVDELPQKLTAAVAKAVMAGMFPNEPTSSETGGSFA